MREPNLSCDIYVWCQGWKLQAHEEEWTEEYLATPQLYEVSV